MTLSKQSLSEVLTPIEYKALDNKLAESIKTKIDDDPNSSINLSLFGLQDSDSLRRFLLTPAGETTTERLVTEKENERAIEEWQQQQLQEQIRMEEQRRAFFHFLMEEDEAEAKKAQNELIAMQQEKTMKDEQKAQQKATPPEPNKATQEAIKGYDNTIKQLEEDRKALENRSKKLAQEKNLIENKYDAMEKSLDDAPKFEEQSEAEIRAEIEKLQERANEIADEMMDPKLKLTDEQVYAKGHQLNAIESKIANLNDIIATKKEGGKQFVDAQGKPASMKDAAFVIPRNKEIVKDKNGNYFLIKKGESFDQMTPSQKEEAQKAFQREKKDIQVVRDVVKDTKKEALEFNAKSIAENDKALHLNALSLAQNKAEKTMLENQARLMQSARATVQQSLQQNPTDNLALKAPRSTLTTPSVPLPTLAQTPQSSKVGSTPIQTPQQIFNAAFVQTLNQGQKPGTQTTWGKLFKFVDEIQDPRVKEEADKFLTDEAKKSQSKDKPSTLDNLKEMLKQTPVPEVTMNAFLKHMAAFEEAYKENVTPEQGPIEQQKREPDTISPSATNM
ncbi:coiled coil protein [Legionella sp. PATHC035]|uniref:coiled coil protein n=1 Tax=Legionella sp. PATHC035 TaxID=2992040 RepID=UPI002244D7A7|nr:coiled coil protein [Legionella sp. PATHC035]MCW8407910.1 coiled coil protein [Legionella sp. PATHC035]